VLRAAADDRRIFGSFGYKFCVGRQAHFNPGPLLWRSQRGTRLALCLPCSRRTATTQTTPSSRR
jgi:hypothetical protein